MRKYLKSNIKRKEKLYVCWMITEAGRGRGKYVFEVGRSECPSMPQARQCHRLDPTRLVCSKTFSISKVEIDMKY